MPASSASATLFEPRKHTPAARAVRRRARHREGRRGEPQRPGAAHHGRPGRGRTRLPVADRAAPRGRARPRARPRAGRDRAAPRRPCGGRATGWSASSATSPSAGPPSWRPSVRRSSAAVRPSRPARRCAEVDLSAEDRRPEGVQRSSPLKPLLVVLNVGEESAATSPARSSAQAWAVARAARAWRSSAVCATLEQEISLLAPDDQADVPRRPRPARPGARPAAARRLLAARAGLVLHRRRRGRVPRLVDPGRHPRRQGRRDRPHRHGAGVHPRRGHAVAGAGRGGLASPPAARTARCAWRARTTPSGTAT